MHQISRERSLGTISSIPERIMPRFTRENTIEEKRRMRNERNKRKRLLRTAKKREAVGILRQKERAAYSPAKEMARTFYFRWRQLVEQNKTRTLDKTKVSLYSDTPKSRNQCSLKQPGGVYTDAKHCGSKILSYCAFWCSDKSIVLRHKPSASTSRWQKGNVRGWAHHLKLYMHLSNFAYCFTF